MITQKTRHPAGATAPPRAERTGGGEVGSTAVLFLVRTCVVFRGLFAGVRAAEARTRAKLHPEVL